MNFKSFVVIVCLAFVCLLTIHCGKKGSSTDLKVNDRINFNGNLRIAFVYSDSILLHYELAVQMREELMKEGDKLQKTLASKQSQFESDAKYFQESVQKNALSEKSAQEIYQQLAAKEQELYGLKDQYTMQIANKEMEMNLKLLDSVNEFLDSYAKLNNFDYILNYSKGGALFYANGAYDITNDVLEKLNEDYKSKLSKK